MGWGGASVQSTRRRKAQCALTIDKRPRTRWGCCRTMNAAGAPSLRPDLYTVTGEYALLLLAVASSLRWTYSSVSKTNASLCLSPSSSIGPPTHSSPSATVARKVGRHEYVAPAR